MKLVESYRWSPDRNRSFSPQEAVERDCSQTNHDGQLENIGSRLEEVTSLLARLVQHLVDKNLMSGEELLGILSCSYTLEEEKTDANGD